MIKGGPDIPAVDAIGTHCLGSRGCWLVAGSAPSRAGGEENGCVLWDGCLLVNGRRSWIISRFPEVIRSAIGVEDGLPSRAGRSSSGTGTGRNQDGLRPPQGASGPHVSRRVDGPTPRVRATRWNRRVISIIGVRSGTSGVRVEL
jgi:hypothetical protein